MGSSESSLHMDDGEPSNSINQGDFVQDTEDPWWWEIENQNLLLDVVSDEVVDFVGPSTSVATELRNSSVPREGGELTVKQSDRRSGSPPVQSELETQSASENSVQENQGATPTVRQEQSLEDFKEELKAKRMARQTAVNDLREEILALRRQLADEREALRRPKDEVKAGATTKEEDEHSDEEKAVEHRKKLIEESDRVFAQQVSDDEVVSGSTNPKVQLAETQLALQLANAENLSLNTELGVTRKQVVSLKEVVACCKQMITMKEEQVVQLKAKLREIEDSLAERELKLMSDNLRQEYDRQLANMRTLRQLYEERARVSAAERENLQRQISIKKDELEVEKEKTKNVEERNAGLEKELETANKELQALKEQCSEHRFENKTLKEEMGAVNKLFSQMLMGFNGTNNLDIDRLTTMLEENRTLLNDMATKEATSEGATLPKLLFELVQQAAVANIQPSETESSACAVGQTNRRRRGPRCDEVADEDENSHEITRYRSSTVVGTGTTEISYPPSSSSSATAADDRATATAAASPSLFTTPNACGVPTIEADVSSDGNAEQTASGGNAITTNDDDDDDVNESLHEDVLTTTSRRQDCHQHESGTTPDHNQSEVMAKVASAEEIIGNLPKVWKVLMELLSHHKIERVQFKENGQGEDCFKSVETPNGPKAELSVSKTYIKLKDLILEKKSLVKETTRLKTLNCHLEYRLNEQEKRLSAVSLELQKTWHLVGKMQRQHRQLHTQEQILRYQLQQKRRLLSELKDELEYCRRKWAAARAKNDESQLQCDDLRKEFARRKLQDAHNSAESGYSDGPGSDEDDATAAAKAAAPVTKNWAEVFEVKSTVKRMQSTSPGRTGIEGGELELRWSSAPPAVNWPADDSLLLVEDEPSASGSRDSESMQEPRRSRSKMRGGSGNDDVEENPDSEQSDRTTRIQRLEEQCKSLIAAVIQTSDNRERLEVQLCRFQDEIAPAQYAVPLDQYIARTQERMTRASSAPEIDEDKACLTPREEEYTRKRSERLERLEEESRQLLNRIKRTSDRGNSLRSSLERIHSKRTLSREGSFESNTEEVAAPEETEESAQGAVAPSVEEEDTKYLTEIEEEYTSKRAERLKRLEEESRELLSKLSRNSERGTTFNSKLDALHEKYGSEERDDSTKKTELTIEERLDNVANISSNRDERLRILEEEGRQLLDRLSSTSNRGSRMIDHLNERDQNKNLKTSVEQSGSEVLAGAILPTPKTVACSSIVSEEITERVVVTRTPSQIAQSKGAIPKVTKPELNQPAEQNPLKPKQEPTSKLCAAGGRKRVTSISKDPKSETLEEMVNRLRSLPFPSAEAAPTADSK